MATMTSFASSSSFNASVLMATPSSNSKESTAAGRLTAEEEKSIAREIRKAEQASREYIAGVDEAEDILGRRPERAERTRAGAVDRLEEAVFAVMKEAKSQPELRPLAGKAMTAWKLAESLRWRLAMSGRRIAHGEARKLAGPFMDEEDLVQEGYIGLLRAAKRFDPDRGIRLHYFLKGYAEDWCRTISRHSKAFC